jgi:hypothetical protein
VPNQSGCFKQAGSLIPGGSTMTIGTRSVLFGGGGGDDGGCDLNHIFAANKS